MQETEKIWMNGELVDWADAKVHVGVHGLHYGSGVFEGIRCYETPKGPAVFRLNDHLQRLHDSARLLYMELPYTVDELRDACHELIGVNGLPECYLRPIAFYGYGQLGVAARENPVETVIMSWPWGAYLGDDGMKTGIRAKISSWQRIGPNVIPHVSKATGVYLNSMLAVTEAIRAGYDEAILLTASGTIADGSGENIFVVKDGTISTPSLATSILPGITRDTIIQIAQDLGYTVDETDLIRSDLYLADEVFMCGTAAEVTPLRSVDDVEIGVGPITLADPEGVPRHRARQERALGAVARPHGHARTRRGVSRATTRIPLSRPYLDEREEELVLDVLRSGRLSLGPTIERFEELIAERTGAPYAAALSSGTAGLHLLARIAGVGPGDEVITSTFSFVASANCFVLEGATPVFADVDPRTLNLDPAAVEAAVTERTKAIVAVDIFGYPCELDELRAIADRHGLALIDDACEALGAEYKGAPVGSHGISAVFAFYPNKQITTGEGGIVTTHSEDEAKLLRSLRNQGRSYEAGRWFHHPYLGFNYRWTDIQAAVGIGQLEKLDEILELRAGRPRATPSCWRTSTASRRRCPTTPTTCAPGSSTSSCSTRASTGRASPRSSRSDGIECGEYVPCIHLQPYMRERVRLRRGPLPGRGGREPRARSRSRSSRASSAATRNGSRRRSPRRSPSNRVVLAIIGA